MSNGIDMLHERLRWARVTAGISCRELDRLSGTTPGHAWAVEQGNRGRHETRTIAAFARALGVSLDWLVHGEGEEPTAEHIAAAVAARRTSEPTTAA